MSPSYKILTRPAADRNFELDQIRDAGAKFVRLDASPNNQAQLDPVVDGVVARGMEPVLILYSSSAPQGVPLSGVADFVKSQAVKWKGKVRVFELLNEPDLNGWTPQTYTPVLKSAYPALKAGNPDAILSTGGIWTWRTDEGPEAPNMADWILQMYQAGAKGYFDAVALHLYEDPFKRGYWNPWDQAFHLTPSVRSVMNSYGDQHVPIWSSENGANVNKHGGESGAAQMISNQIKAVGVYPVAAVTTYTMGDDTLSSVTSPTSDGWGLLRIDRSRRPAWYAYQQGAGG
jgi:hypothetical protein